MIYLIFIGGVVVGSLISSIFHWFRAGYGHFNVVPINDPDLDDVYTVRITIGKDQQLQKKKKIILQKDNSLK